jgi:hypothetical protein
MISDSLKYRRAPMINGRGKLRSGRTTQLKIVRGATLNSLATAGLVINLSGCIRSLRLVASAAYEYEFSGAFNGIKLSKKTGERFQLLMM